MKKKGAYIVVLLVILLSIALSNAIYVSNSKVSGKASKVVGEVTGDSVTGEATSQSIGLNITIVSDNVITIASPQNLTYNFTAGDIYLIDLNVSSNFNADTWWYNLIDLRNNRIINSSIIFTPNSTIEAVRWENRLEVYANDSINNITNKNVTFEIYVENSHPYIEYLDEEIFFCEGNQSQYQFNVTDINKEDTLLVDISPKNPFYILDSTKSAGINITFEIYSPPLNKTHAGGPNSGYYKYEETITASDNFNDTCCVDYGYINLTVIEINNPPVIDYIGTNQTVWTQGINSNFYYQVLADDTEDGNQDSYNLTFNISFSGDPLFNISSTGILNFTPDSSQVGVHNITICASDLGLQSPHQNLTQECGVTSNPSYDCAEFSLTITEGNRPPTITSYWPLTSPQTAAGNANIYFNITSYDPDETIPDAYWYVDDSLVEFDNGSLINELNYNFNCVAGEHTIEARITDGILNDSVQWNYTITACPETPPSSGGASLETGQCNPKWICEDWSTCENIEQSLKKGVIFGENYRSLTENCSEQNWLNNTCGYQTRDCSDIFKCSNFDHKEEIKACYYTSQPSCFDNIKNCHNGACELLIDCGGPCVPCPTCSDGIKNQGESGIDCGGPCPNPCPSEKPLPKIPKTNYFLLILLILLLIAILIQLIKILKIKRKAKKIKIYHVLIFVGIILALGIYFYPKHSVGDLVYKKGQPLVGEIKDSSFTNYFVEWQDGTYTKENPFSLGKVGDLDVLEIKSFLQADNEKGMEFYFWNSEGKVITSESPDSEAFPKISPDNLDELQDHSIKIGNEKCLPKFICEEWGECKADYNLGRIADKELAQGQQFRLCKDSEKCMSDFFQSKKCRTTIEITVEKRDEKGREYVEVYGPDNNLVFRMTREKVEEVKKLYIELFIN